MEIVGDVFDPKYPNRRRQAVVQNDLDVFDRDRRIRLEGRNLSEGMDSRVGAS